MSDWSRLGAAFGAAIARLVPESAAKRIRAHYAKMYGICRVCEAPLGGPSPERICETCHAGEVFAAGLAEGIAAADAERREA